MSNVVAINNSVAEAALSVVSGTETRTSTDSSGAMKADINDCVAHDPNQALVSATFKRKSNRREAVLKAICAFSGWVTFKTLERKTEFGTEALRKQLSRLVANGVIEKKDHHYRLMKQRKPRLLKPLRDKSLPSGRPEISRSDLVHRGWTRDLIDDWLTGYCRQESKTFVVSRIMHVN